MRALVLAATVGTAVLVLRHDGTLTITAAAEQCARATAMELWRKSSEPILHPDDQPSEVYALGVPSLGRGAIRIWFTRIAREAVGPECRWSYSDLPEGIYVAVLQRSGGSGGSQQVIRSAGTDQAIEIPAPTVTLSGVVTLDGKPQSHASIRLTDRSWTRPSITVSGDADGHYAATLDRPETYTITVTIPSPRALGARVTALQAGANELDIPVRTPNRGETAPPTVEVPPGRVDFPPSGPPKDIARALADAAKDGKHVLLDFGADWCIDCKVLEQAFRDPAIAAFLNDHFHVVRIDLGVYYDSDKIKNADTAAKYGVGTIKIGIPALVLLDPHGRVVQPKDRVAWRMASDFTVPQVLDYLTQLATMRQ